MQGYNCSRRGKHPQFTFDYSGCPVLPTGFFAKNPGTWHGVRPIRPLFTSVWMWLIRGSQVSCRLRILISWVQALEFNWFLFLVGGFGGFPQARTVVCRSRKEAWGPAAHQGMAALPLTLLLPGGIAVVPVEVPQIQTRSAVTFSDAAGLCLFPRRGRSCQYLTTPHVTIGIGKMGMTGLRDQELLLRF